MSKNMSQQEIPDRDEMEFHLNEYTLDALKIRCADIGISTDGKKQEIVKRLADARIALIKKQLREEEAEQGSESSYQSADEDDKFVSKEEFKTLQTAFYQQSEDLQKLLKHFDIGGEKDKEARRTEDAPHVESSCRSSKSDRVQRDSDIDNILLGNIGDTAVYSEAEEQNLQTLKRFYPKLVRLREYVGNNKKRYDEMTKIPMVETYLKIDPKDDVKVVINKLMGIVKVMADLNLHPVDWAKFAERYFDVSVLTNYYNGLNSSARHGQIEGCDKWYKCVLFVLRNFVLTNMVRDWSMKLMNMEVKEGQPLRTELLGLIDIGASFPFNNAMFSCISKVMHFWEIHYVATFGLISSKTWKSYDEMREDVKQFVPLGVIVGNKRAQDAKTDSIYVNAIGASNSKHGYSNRGYRNNDPFATCPNTKGQTIYFGKSCTCERCMKSKTTYEMKKHGKDKNQIKQRLNALLEILDSDDDGNEKNSDMEGETVDDDEDAQLDALAGIDDPGELFASNH